VKRIIDGKIYNTETATCVAGTSARLPVNDFGWFEESLYVTKNGRWFLAGEGGPMSGYAQSVGQNQWGGGASLWTLTADEAMEWLERHEETGAIEEHFAAQVEEG